MMAHRNTTIAKWIKATAFTATLLVSATAHAGANLVAPVVVDQLNGRASGAAVDARFSADSVQEIGCTINSTTLSCFAKDQYGRTMSCITSNPSVRQLHAASSIGDTSYIVFNSGSCSELSVNNNSKWMR